MVAQQKILRVFKLIQLLKGTRKRTAVEISEMMEISKRTFYRYLNLLEELGFEVELDFEGRYFIPTNEGDEIDFTFNSEESILIREALLKQEYPKAKFDFEKFLYHPKIL